MIEIINLTKRYGSKVALSDVSFQVKKGEVVGFLGPNGAGKSTTMNIICGYLSASQGSVKIDGIDILDNPIAAKKKIGYLPEQPPLYLNMTVDEYLNFVYELKKCKLNRTEHLNQVKELVKVTDVSSRLIKNLSKGYRQRVGFAQALVGNPEVLILDEPTVGLDPKQIIEIRNLIGSLTKEHTIILSSHILPEVSAICERVVIINEGKIVAEDTPENLSANMSGERRLMVTVEGAPEAVLDVLGALPEVKRANLVREKEDGSLDVLVESETDVRKKVSATLAEQGFSLLMMRNESASLEDIFIQLTQKEESVHESDI